MVIIQIILKTKVFSLYSIKRVSKLLFKNFLVLLSFSLVSCSSYSIKAEEIKADNLKCGSSSITSFFKKNGIYNSDDENFNYKLSLIDKSLSKKDFNFIYISKPRNSGGYVLKVEKIIKIKDKYQIYFEENKSSHGSGSITAITSTFCLMKLPDLDKIEVFIN
tara:strand:+ start:4903 stop:5391 length:489 start_codon:yes stop_codon:yes gene_type:complete